MKTKLNARRGVGEPTSHRSESRSSRFTTESRADAVLDKISVSNRKVKSSGNGMPAEATNELNTDFLKVQAK